MTTSVSADSHRDIAISESASLKLSGLALVNPSSMTAIESENMMPNSSNDSEVCHSAAPFSSSKTGGPNHMISEDSTTPSQENPTSEQLQRVSGQESSGGVRAEILPGSRDAEKDDGTSHFFPANPVRDDKKSDWDESNDLLEERVRQSSEHLHQYSKYVELMENRLSYLEEKFQNLEPRGKSVKPLAKNSKNSMIPELRYVRWGEFKTKYATDKEEYAIEVLVGGARYWYQLSMDQRLRKLNARADQAIAADITDSLQAELETSDELPQRIRINSPELVAILSDISLETWPTKPIVLLTPYKLLVQYDSEIRDFFTRLKLKFSSKTSSGTDDHDAFSKADTTLDPCNVHNEKPSKEIGRGTENEDDSTDNKSRPLNRDYQEAPNDLLGSREAFEALKCLIKFMDSHLTPIIKQFRECTREHVQFHELWHLFKVGDIIYSPKKSGPMESGIERAAPDSVSEGRYQTTFRVYSVVGGRPILKSQDDTKNQPQLKDRVRIFEICCYYIDYDAGFIPVTTVIKMHPFEGKRKITSLKAYPLRCAKNHDAIKEEFLARGFKFKSVLKIKHMFYTGPTYITIPNGSKAKSSSNVVEQINSEVIVDFAEARRNTDFVCLNDTNLLYGYASSKDRGILEFKEDYPTVVWEDRDEKEALISYDAIFNDNIIEIRRGTDYLSNDPFLKSVEIDSELGDKTHKPLRDEDILLLTGRVVAYVLRDRKFAMLNVENLLSFKPNPDGFTDLKLPSGHKEMVQALVRSHSMKRDNNSSIKSNVDHDVVAGKGRGLIILLHGVPGVGKTSTAECVAESTGRPLFPITCGDLGLTPHDVEESLKEIFQLAQLWDCVLLLDEADVFLSQRTKTDLQRNALVSVFLRVLEYYQGILFLTTNRVGAFDEAFKSRIHISLYYPELAKTQSLKIWEMNLKRARKIELERTRTQTMPGMIIDEEDIKSYAEIHWIENQNGVGKWNGRQIRNAFQTASALALYEAHMKNANQLRENPDGDVTPPQLKRKHFEKVAKATTQFGEYMEATVGKDDADASHFRGDRTDHFRLKSRSTARQPANNPQVYSQPYTPPDLQPHYPRTPTPNFPTIRHRQAPIPSGAMRSEASPATGTFVDHTDYVEFHGRAGLTSIASSMTDEIEYE